MSRRAVNIFDSRLAVSLVWGILAIVSLAIAILAIWKHRSNIQRLREGTEHRFTRKPKPGNV